MTTPAILDLSAVGRLLPGTGPLTARLLPQGRFNTCWHVTDGDRSYLLKLNDREGEAHLRTMAAAMNTAAAGGVAVPRVLRVGVDPHLGPFLLQEWLVGQTFAQAREDDRVEPKFWMVLGKQIALLHTTAPAHPVTVTRASRTQQLSMLLERIRRQHLIPETLAEAARRHGQNVSEGLSEQCGVNTHQDIHPDNILLRPSGAVALLDFDHATVAEYASDFVKIDRWCLPTGHERVGLLDSYWQQRGEPADPQFEQRLAFHRLLITLSYFLYWHERDATQIPGCTAALKTELEQP